MLKTKEEIAAWLDEMNIKEYSIDDDLSVTVIDDVRIDNKQLKEIPVQFKLVSGDFICSNNELTSLRGCPEEIYRGFCCANNKLVNLVGGPFTVGDFYDCRHNSLENLEGAPDFVGENFNCEGNQITELDYFPLKVDGNFICRSNPIVDITNFDCNFAGVFLHGSTDYSIGHYKIPLLKDFYDLNRTIEREILIHVCSLTKEKLMPLILYAKLTKEITTKELEPKVKKPKL